MSTLDIFGGPRDRFSLFSFKDILFFVVSQFQKPIILPTADENYNQNILFMFLNSNVFFFSNRA